MRLRSLVLFGLFSIGLASMAARVIKPYDMPLRPVPVGAGAEMFVNYCASCHGMDGTGNGPVSRALNAIPSDLTILEKRNGGVFPSEHVKAAIRGELFVVAHGSKDMPVWGQVFSYLGGGTRGEVTLRIDNLTRYVESIQEPGKAMELGLISPAGAPARSSSR